MARASFYLYTAPAEIDTLVDGLMLALRRASNGRGRGDV
jgi:selenocysteine lyase/cysteine desulfurase